jgi:hypothetical protein
VLFQLLIPGLTPVPRLESESGFGHATCGRRKTTILTSIVCDRRRTQEDEEETLREGFGANAAAEVPQTNKRARSSYHSIRIATEHLDAFHRPLVKERYHFGRRSQVPHLHGAI